NKLGPFYHRFWRLLACCRCQFFIPAVTWPIGIAPVGLRYAMTGYVIRGGIDLAGKSPIGSSGRRKSLTNIFGQQTISPHAGAGRLADMSQPRSIAAALVTCLIVG